MIDGHAHLESLADPAAALERAAAVGVSGVVAVGMDPVSNRTTRELALRFPGVVLPAAGLHPWRLRAATLEADLDEVARALPECVALGEVGLDYKVKTPKALQWEAFGRLLALAAAGGKPVIVHCRYSHDRAHRMVAAAGVARAVFHWYSGPLDVLGRLLEDGYCVSATPALARSQAHRAAIALAPPERILLETDAPVPWQGRPSTPADLPLALTALADLRGWSEAETAALTTANTERLLQPCR